MARKPKGDTGTNGSDTITAKGGWEAAAAASAKASAPVQTRLDIGTDDVTEYQELELRIPLSDDEVTMLDRRSAEALADADEEQERLNDYSKPIKDEIKKLRTAASKDAADSKARSRAQMQRVRVVYSPNTATVRFFNPDTSKEVMLSRAMTPAEMDRITDGPMAPPTGERVEVEAYPDGTGDPEVQA